MIKTALQEVRRDVPSFTGPALLAGVGVALVLVVVMLVSPAAGVASLLVLFSFFLLAIASFPARAAWQEGTGWRQTAHGRGRRATEVANAAIALAFLVCAAAAIVWALDANLAGAAITFAVCLVGLAVLGHRYRHVGWVEQTRRGYARIGWGPKLVLAIAWLAVMTPEAISSYDYDELRDGRVWEPAIRTLVAIVPLGWLLWESRLLRSQRPNGQPPEPRGVSSTMRTAG